MKKNKKIEVLIFVFSFLMLITAVIASLNPRFDYYKVFLDFLIFATLFGSGFIFSWFFGKRFSWVCEKVSQVLFIVAIFLFAYRLGVTELTLKPITLATMIDFVIWLQIALSFNLKKERDFYLTYFLSFVLILYGALISVSIFYSYLFLFYFITGAVVLSLESFIDFDLEGIAKNEKKSIFFTFLIFFSLTVVLVIIVAFFVYLIVPRWKVPYHFNDFLTQNVSDFQKQLFSEEEKKLCNNSDFDKTFNRLLKSTFFSRMLIESEKEKIKLRTKEEKIQPIFEEKDLKIKNMDLFKQSEVTSAQKLEASLESKILQEKTEREKKVEVKTDKNITEQIKEKSTRHLLKKELARRKFPEKKIISKKVSLKKNNFLYILLFLIFFLLSILIYYFLNFGHRLRILWDSPNGFVVYLYHQLIKKLKRKGYIKKLSETPREFWKSLFDCGHPAFLDYFFKFIKLFEFAFYSGQKISQTQVSIASKLYESMTRLHLKKLKRKLT